MGIRRPFGYRGPVRVRRHVLGPTRELRCGVSLWGEGEPSAAPGRTTPVTRYPATAWGLHDAHGNVWEWCADWYGEAYYATLPLRDPPGPPEGRFRVLRGGSWRNHATACRAAYRNALAPHQRDSATGFRVCCVLNT
nr:formylglycine-generating enzyme family protein [Gemmata sp. SH-PL17]